MQREREREMYVWSLKIERWGNTIHYSSFFLSTSTMSSLSPKDNFGHKLPETLCCDAVEPEELALTAGEERKYKKTLIKSGC